MPNKIAVQHGVDAIPQAGLLLHQRLKMSHLMPQRPGGRVGGPDWRDEICGEQLRQDRAVDSIGFSLGARDGLCTHRIGDDHLSGVRTEQVGNRPRVDGFPGRPRARRSRQSTCGRQARSIACHSPLWDAAGHHDTYAFALIAQPGQSQGRPDIRADSWSYSRRPARSWWSLVPHSPALLS